MSQGRPAKCTGTIARVRGVILSCDAIRIDVHRARVDVREHRRRARVDDRVHRRAERERRRDHLVARLGSRGEQAEVQRRRARVHRDGVLRRW